MNEPTHVTTQPNRKPALPIDTFKVELNDQYKKTVENYFNHDKEKSLKFMTAVVTAVQKTPGLLECERGSLFNAFVTCAEYKLYPSSVSGEAYVIPYKGKAQFQLGVQGIITLLYRAGIDSIQANIVYKDDFFEYEEGLEPRLVHKPDVFKAGGRGEAIGVYAVALVNGQKLFKVMSKDEVMKYKEFSQSKGSQYSPWNAANDPQLFMWQKTAMKQLAKYLPKNDELQKAIAEDNKESTVADRNNSLDAGGAAVGKAFHTPEQKPVKEVENELKDDVEIIKDEDAPPGDESMMEGVVD